MNNIFDYAPKELVMDAFFAWIFKELNTPKLSKHKLHFLESLHLDGFNVNSEITQIERQKCNTDLLITIENKIILFENKTTSTIHSNQLANYKKALPNCHKYIYMKLGFIDYKEQQQASANGYIIVSIENIIRALEPLKQCCQIVNQYYEFLETRYIKKSQDICNAIKKNDETIYRHSDAQRIFLSDLYEKLYSKNLYAKNKDTLTFRYSANKGGTPWTQLGIAHKDKQYGDTKESIFWRIDKKKKDGYYIRLTQYANIEKTYKKEKKDRLNKLRECFEELVKKKSSLKSSKVSNEGLKSSEIGIFYFKNNEYDKLFKALVDLSIEFVEKYKKL